MTMDNLLAKYRPCRLADVLGQPEVVKSLTLFVKSAYPVPLLFHGESGVGKTACAYALAHELGCKVDEAELGGIHEIRSGEMKVDRVETVYQLLRLRPLFGSGWKVLICNESDRMSQAVETLFLDALEHLPAKTVVIFTTNCPERMTRRFRDRCENYHFKSSHKDLAPAIRVLALKVWKGEVGKKHPYPDPEGLGIAPASDGLFEGMHASFRLALQQLTRLIREARLGDGDLASVKKQLARDLLVTSKAFSVKCEHCGHQQDVPKGFEHVTCAECAKTLDVEW
jgi:replication-associated recombination protein RarA/ribosomal protein S27E